MDENRDELLERKQTALEQERSRHPVERAIAEIEELVPAVSATLRASRYGQDAIARATNVIERARAALATRDPARLAEVQDGLDRTLQLFKGLAAGAGQGGGSHR